MTKTLNKNQIRYRINKIVNLDDSFITFAKKQRRVFEGRAKAQLVANLVMNAYKSSFNESEQRSIRNQESEDMYNYTLTFTKKKVLKLIEVLG